MAEPRPKDRPWIIRTYAGHTSARDSNALFHRNLAKGQTGLSVAFDLPTQTGCDADDPMARGEVGKVGVPIGHIGDMRTLLEGIDLSRSNTSMTINATAVWLLALYVAVADEQGVPRDALAGTTQNDILKEYLSRGTYIFPPGPSMRLTTDLITWTLREAPRWTPINVCSYHLQEAGAGPALEIAFTMANAIAVLDAVRDTGRVGPEDFGRLVGRIAFFCNAGIRFIEEMCKMRAFTQLWDRITLERYGVGDPAHRRFRYGLQVNSLGLAAMQPENNVYRILLEALAATLSKDARARAVQLPAWNEALGLPRPWDQQWSLRAQQILAEETDLLEYPDLFTGSPTVEAKTARLVEQAAAELEQVLAAGGSIEALPTMKERLVAANAARQRAIESGELPVVGVNVHTETEPSPLVAAGAGGIQAVQMIAAEAEREVAERLAAWRAGRDAGAAAAALDALRRAAASGDNLVPPSIEAAKAGVTTGEWARALKETFGEYRAPTGVTARSALGTDGSLAPGMLEPGRVSDGLAASRRKVEEAARAVGAGRLRLLVAKPGLDGHSNAAEQVAVRARDVGFEVVYQGIRLPIAEIARAAVDEDVHAIGVSILSGAHNLLVPDLLDALRRAGVDTRRVPVIVGGMIPEPDAAKLLALGVARVFTARDHDLTASMAEIADLIRSAHNGG
ncbi:MAG TPA: protein meaA [Actinomycetota bacterium]